MTISAGISIFTQGREAAELVTEADQRMYEAKRSHTSASSTQATS
ncbi:MAG: diguanylate cyclase domain-containing protein [Candidatus Acidiferrales bacterium]